MLDAFLEENPDATEEELFLSLGSPEELAGQFIEEFEQLREEHLVSSRFFCKLTNILLVVSLVCISVVVYLYFSLKGYINIETTQYIYSTNDPAQSPSSTITYHFDREDNP